MHLLSISFCKVDNTFKNAYLEAYEEKDFWNIIQKSNVLFRPMILKFLQSNKTFTNHFYNQLLDMNLNYIQYVPLHCEDVYIGALKRNYYLLAYMPQTPKLCLEAIKISPFSICLIEEPTEQMKTVACKKIPELIYLFEDPSEILIDIAIEQDTDEALFKKEFKQHKLYNKLINHAKQKSNCATNNEQTSFD